MISVEEAQQRLIAMIAPLGAEQIAISEALGRVLAEDVVARRTQPPWAVSAMDGYAARAADVASVPARLKVIGAVPAGQAYAGTVKPGEAVRIFTGAPVPEGADCIVIQEDTERQGEFVEVREGAPRGRYIRPAGLDFREGEIGLKAGRKLSAADVGFAAAMNRPWLLVHRRPRVAILPTGDEVVMPGDPVGPHQIVSSNGIALAALVTACGGVPVHLAIAPDDNSALQRIAAGAAGADLLLTTGGASVGDHDLVRSHARFLDRRHAAGQAADGRALSRDTDDRLAWQSGLDPRLRPPLRQARHGQNVGHRRGVRDPNARAAESAA
jgi:molybdopterin molybdotransferase